MKKIGLYFGSFNPIHVGHLIIANYMTQHPDLDQVWLVVSPQNPHKQKSTLLPDFQRLNLVRLAIDDNPKLRASDVEFKLSKPSYTVTTLAYLKEQYSDHQFALIMGEDNLRSLHKWYNYEYILENHRIYVYPRLGENSKEEAPPLKGHAAIEWLDNTPQMKISSSFIREMIAEGKEVRYLLTEPVFQYVDEMNLYKKRK
ncbi:MAG: nicotinate-nucleotide adenylyltransferase [Bacteroidetes bacterium]|nr:MAG: nicotinate-nucleotide adenylyltransferase [Bacteroidota bacterium]